MNGVTMVVKAAHLRLCHSRMPFVRVYPRESQEMVFDAHLQRLRLLQGRLHARHLRQYEDGGGDGVPGQGAPVQPALFADVQPLSGGADRLYAGLWLGEGAGQTVGLIRERFFTPRVRVKSFDELNAWLLDRCVAYAKAHKHPEFKDQTIWQAFEAERASLVAVPGRFDGFHAIMASVSKTCLVSFDRNKYSVSSQAVGRPVEVQAYADRIVIRQDGSIVGEHARSFGRGQTVYNPWHYVPVFSRKPGALRNGAPSRTGYCRHRWSACGTNCAAPMTATGKW